MKRLASNAAGGILLLALLALAMQGSLILAGLAIGASVGLTLLVYFGPDRLGIGLLLLATFLAPINGLKLGSGGNVTFADFAYVLGLVLLLPRLLKSSSKMPRLYVWGVMILLVDALIVSMIAASPGSSLAGFVRLSWAVMVIPIAFHRIRPARKLLNAFAWAYVIGQIVSTAKGLTVSGARGGGRSIGWTTHPNFFGLGGQLSFALLIFLFYRTPREKRWIVVLAALIVGASVYQSGSRASLLCVAVSVIVWPIVERTAVSTYIVLSAAAVGAVGLNYALSNASQGSALARLQGGGSAGGSDQARTQLLHQGWQLFWAHPIKGNGWSTDILAYHNAYLEVAIGGGVFAVVGFVLVIASLVKPLFDEPIPNRLAFAGLSYAMFAALGPTLYDRILWGALALIFALHYEEGEQLEAGEERIRRHQPQATTAASRSSSSTRNPALTPRRTP